MSDRAHMRASVSSIAAIAVLGLGLIGLRGVAGWRQDATRHRAVMQSPLGNALFLNNALRIVDAGGSLAALFATTPGKLIGRPIDTVIIDGHQTLEKLATQPCPRNQPRHIKRLTGRYPDGKTFAIEIVVARLHGVAAGWLVIVHSVNESRRLERLKSDFVATVSHELRTPLSSIAGALGLVEAGFTGPLSDDATEMVSVALNNTNRLILIINDLLDIERIESGKLHFDLEVHSLSAIVQTAIDDIRPFADEHSIQIDYIAGESDDFVHVDGNRAIQIFNNLLSNAIKFSPRDGAVRVMVQAGSIYHKVEIVDNGPGIPEAFRDRLYEKFAQADGSSSRQVGGTGLGLAICREIINRLDGKLRFSPNPTGGSVFTVELPASRAPARSTRADASA